MEVVEAAAAVVVVEEVVVATAVEAVAEAVVEAVVDVGSQFMTLVLTPDELISETCACSNCMLNFTQGSSSFFLAHHHGT